MLPRCRRAATALPRALADAGPCRQRSTLREPLLYSYGEGFLGALGSGDYADIATPTPVIMPDDVGAIRELSAGWAHGGFITDEGDAYLFGRTHSFRDVIRATNMHRLVPWLLRGINYVTMRTGIDTLVATRLTMPEGERVRKMVCSAALTFLLTESGKLFTLGANGYGQCGNGAESVRVGEPEHIVIGDGERVRDVAAGYQHGLVVTEAGNVFSWGKGERGQLGFGTANIKSPQEVIALKNRQIVQVSAGFNHSSALTSDGELYLWGKLLNPNGKAESNGDQVIPRLVKTRDAVRLLQCSHFHTAFVTADHKAWIVGRTPSGRREQDDQLLHVSPEMHTRPFELPAADLKLNKVIKLGKGVDNTSFITSDGDAFEWTFASGIQRVPHTRGLRVRALESGFRYRLLLGSETS